MNDRSAPHGSSVPLGMGSSRKVALLAMLAVGCASADPPAPAGPAPEDAGLDPASTLVEVVGALDARGVPITLWLDGDTIAAPPPEGTRPRARWALDGLHVVPAFIDAHVHLAYAPREAELLDGGIAAVVDLAAPTPFLATHAAAPGAPKRRALHILAAGPMLTAPRGYPTQSWGRDGFGLELATPDAARAAVRDLVARGAALLKLPLDDDGARLDDATLRAIVDEARRAGRPVFAHALSRVGVQRAAAIGVDGLAHTPVEPLDDADLGAWRGRVVISTLVAFGARASAIDNLRRLVAAGAEVHYGTDFGNSTVAGIDGRELNALLAAGLSGEAILDAATRVPAARWGLTRYGALTPGAAASFVATRARPTTQPSACADAAWVVIDGVPRRRPE